MPEDEIDTTSEASGGRDGGTGTDGDGHGCDDGSADDPRHPSWQGWDDDGGLQGRRSWLER